MVMESKLDASMKNDGGTVAPFLARLTASLILLISPNAADISESPCLLR
jgi:hypothetical protein